MSKVPERTCIACRQARQKQELVRVVRTPDGEVLIDESGKQNGRGAYICRSAACIERARKKRTLSHAFKMEVKPDIYDRLAEYAGDE